MRALQLLSPKCPPTPRLSLRKKSLLDLQLKSLVQRTVKIMRRDLSVSLKPDDSVSSSSPRVQPQQLSPVLSLVGRQVVVEVVLGPGLADACETVFGAQVVDLLWLAAEGLQESRAGGDGGGGDVCYAGHGGGVVGGCSSWRGEAS